MSANQGMRLVIAGAGQDYEALTVFVNRSGVREQIDVDQAVADTGETEDSEFRFDTDDFQFNGEPWNRETNPVDIKWLPNWLNDRINDEIEGSPEKAKQINENPNLIVDKVFDILPATMFILLPVVALIFKFWYLFAKKYYVEHLIFALHNHSFIFVAILIVGNQLANVLGVEVDHAKADRFYKVIAETVRLTPTANLEVSVSRLRPILNAKHQSQCHEETQKEPRH